MNKQLLEILNLLKDYTLYAKLGGSSCLSFIKNKHDCDVIIVCKDLETSIKCMSLFRKNYRPRDIEFDVHFSSKENEELHLLENPYYSYILKDSLLTNYDVENVPIDEILKNQNKTIQRIRQKIEGNNTEDKYRNKIWYRTYITLCMYKNKAFEFTDDQIENINILHDRKEEDIKKRTKLIDNIIKEIQEWQI